MKASSGPEICHVPRLLTALFVLLDVAPASVQSTVVDFNKVRYHQYRTRHFLHRLASLFTTGRNVTCRSVVVNVTRPIMRIMLGVLNPQSAVALFWLLIPWEPLNIYFYIAATDFMVLPRNKKLALMQFSVECCEWRQWKGISSLLSGYQVFCLFSYQRKLIVCQRITNA